MMKIETKQNLSNLVRALNKKGIDGENLRLCVHVVLEFYNRGIDADIILDTMKKPTSAEIIERFNAIYTSMEAAGKMNKYVPATMPPPPYEDVSGNRGASRSASLEGSSTREVGHEIKSDHQQILVESAKSSDAKDKQFAIALLNRYNVANGFDEAQVEGLDDSKIEAIEQSVKHVEKFLKYIDIDGPNKKQIEFLVEERGLEPFYDIDDNIEFLGQAFKESFAHNNFSKDEKNKLLKQYYLEHEIHFGNSQNQLDTRNYYENFERLFNSIDDKLNLVDFLVSIHPKTGLQLLPMFLDEAVVDTTTPIGKHYLNSGNIDKVIDAYYSLEAPESFKKMIQHPNFKSIIESSDDRKKVAEVFKSSIEKLSKLLGKDECQNVLNNVAEQLGDEARSLQKKIIRKFPQHATPVDNPGNLPDDIYQRQEERQNFFNDTTPPSKDKKFSYLNDTSKTTVGVAVAGFLASGGLIIAASIVVGAAVPALGVAAGLVSVIAALGTMASSINDRNNFNIKESNDHKAEKELLRNDLQQVQAAQVVQQHGSHADNIQAQRGNNQEGYRHK